MPDFSVIDAHIHTYRMAEMGWQAQQGTGRSGYAGTVEEYLDVLAADGIEKAIMVNTHGAGAQAGEAGWAVRTAKKSHSALPAPGSSRQAE